MLPSIFNTKLTLHPFADLDYKSWLYTPHMPRSKGWIKTWPWSGIRHDIVSTDAEAQHKEVESLLKKNQTCIKVPK